MKRAVSLFAVFVLLCGALALSPAPPAQAIGQVVIFSETFEGAFPEENGWNVSDCYSADGLEYMWNDQGYFDWDTTTGEDWAGWVAAGGADGYLPTSLSVQYPNHACTAMTIGPISLAGVSAGHLYFKYWAKTELHYDFFGYRISPDGTNYYGIAFSGNSGGWQTGDIDLTNVPGLGNVTGDDSIWISFSFDSDYSNTDSGVYLDNISLSVYKACYQLSLGYSGPGSAPSASPTSSGTCSPGYYYAGESITLTAYPGGGSFVNNWSGTDYDSSTSDTNTLTMPAANHSVSVAYSSQQDQAFFSEAHEDGWVLESAEESNKGGKLNSAGAVINIGDDKYDRQYRGILSFDTSDIPDNAIIEEAFLGFTVAGVSGTSPFKTHGPLLVDIRKGYFGPSILLQAVDWKSAASLSNAADPFGSGYGQYFTFLKSGSLGYINKTGYTQIRLRFKKGDNDDHGVDIIKVQSGSVYGYEPHLHITWRLP